MFGIRVKDTWLSWEETEEICFLLDLKTAPVIGIYNTSDFETPQDFVIKSTFGSEDTYTGETCTMEGIVVRNYDSYNSTEGGQIEILHKYSNMLGKIMSSLTNTGQKIGKSLNLIIGNIYSNMGYLIFIVIGVFLYLLYKNKKFDFKKPEKYLDVMNMNLSQDQKYNSQKVDRQREVDRILEKITKSGLKSLSKTEKNYLDKYSNE